MSVPQEIQLVALHDASEGWMEENKSYTQKKQRLVGGNLQEVILESDKLKQYGITLYLSPPNRSQGETNFLEICIERKEFGDMNYDVFLYSGQSVNQLFEVFRSFVKPTEEEFTRCLHQYEQSISRP